MKNWTRGFDWAVVGLVLGTAVVSTLTYVVLDHFNGTGH